MFFKVAKNELIYIYNVSAVWSVAAPTLALTELMLLRLLRALLLRRHLRCDAVDVELEDVVDRESQ